MTLVELIEKLKALPSGLGVLLVADGLYFPSPPPETTEVPPAYERAWTEGEGETVDLP